MPHGVSPVTFDQLHALYQKCRDLADSVPAEHRLALLEVASQLLTLATDCMAAERDSQQNAPSSIRTQ